MSNSIQLNYLKQHFEAYKKNNSNPDNKPTANGFAEYLFSERGFDPTSYFSKVYPDGNQGSEAEIKYYADDKNLFFQASNGEVINIDIDKLPTGENAAEVYNAGLFNTKAAENHLSLSSEDMSKLLDETSASTTDDDKQVIKNWLTSKFSSKKSLLEGLKGEKLSNLTDDYAQELMLNKLSDKINEEVSLISNLKNAGLSFEKSLDLDFTGLKADINYFNFKLDDGSTKKLNTGFLRSDEIAKNIGNISEADNSTISMLTSIIDDFDPVSDGVINLDSPQAKFLSRLLDKADGLVDGNIDVSKLNYDQMVGLINAKVDGNRVTVDDKTYVLNADGSVLNYEKVVSKNGDKPAVINVYDSSDSLLETQTITYSNDKIAKVKVSDKVKNEDREYKYVTLSDGRVQSELRNSKGQLLELNRFYRDGLASDYTIPGHNPWYGMENTGKLSENYTYQIINGKTVITSQTVYRKDGTFDYKNDFSYNDQGIRTSYKTLDAMGRVKRDTELDSAGRSIGLKTFNADGTVSERREYSRDQAGNVIEEKVFVKSSANDTVGTKISKTYNYQRDAVTGKVTETTVKNASGQTEYVYNYDKNTGILLSYKYTPNGSTNDIRNYVYSTVNGQQKLAEVQYLNADSSLNKKTKYEYDEKGQLIKQLDYAKDELGYVSPKQTIVYNRDQNNGSLISQEIYGANGKLARVDYPNWQASSDSRLTNPSNVVKMGRYDYYDNGKLSYSLVYGYDANGRTTNAKYIYPNGKEVEYVYKRDFNGQVIEEEKIENGKSTGKSQYEYDANGKRSGITYFNAAGVKTQTNKYLVNGQLDDVTYFKADGSVNYNADYSYNAKGQLSSIENRRPDGTLLSSEERSYEANGALSRIDRKNANGVTTRIDSYENGKITSYGYPTYDKSGKLTSVTYKDTAGKVIKVDTVTDGTVTTVKQKGLDGIERTYNMTLQDGVLRSNVVDLGNGKFEQMVFGANGKPEKSFITNEKGEILETRLLNDDGTVSKIAKFENGYTIITDKNGTELQRIKDNGSSNDVTLTLYGKDNETKQQSFTIAK